MGLYLGKNKYKLNIGSSIFSPIIQTPCKELPSIYQEVEYLCGNAGYETYIDLGFAFDTSAEIYLTQIVDDSSVTAYPFGATENGGVQRCCLSSPYAGVATLYGSNNIEFKSNQVTFNANGALNEFKIILKKGYREIINLTTGVTNGPLATQEEYTMTNNLYLFAQNYNGTVRYASTRKIKKFKYYDKNNRLVCDLVPCFRKSDKVRGMFDLVRKIFLTNVGKDMDFAIGPIVNCPVINQVVTSTNIDGSVYNTLGYKDNYRIRSTGDEAESQYSTCTGFIPFKKDDTLLIWPAFTGENTNNVINLFDKDFNCLGQFTDDGTKYGICTSSATYKVTNRNDISAFTLTDNHNGSSDVAYVRITNNIYTNSSISSGGGMIVSVNQQIE